MVEVHSFKVWSVALGKWKFPAAKRTAEAIAELKAEIIPDTGEMVFKAMLDTEGRYIPQKFGGDDT